MADVGTPSASAPWSLFEDYINRHLDEVSHAFIRLRDKTKALNDIEVEIHSTWLQVMRCRIAGEDTPDKLGMEWTRVRHRQDVIVDEKTEAMDRYNDAVHRFNHALLVYRAEKDERKKLGLEPFETKKEDPTSLVGRMFRIELHPEQISEHRNPLLQSYNGQCCMLIQKLSSVIYMTNLGVPFGTPDSDYARDGALLVIVDKDGKVLDG